MQETDCECIRHDNEFAMNNFYSKVFVGTVGGMQGYNISTTGTARRCREAAAEQRRGNKYGKFTHFYDLSMMSLTHFQERRTCSERTDRAETRALEMMKQNTLLQVKQLFHG